MRVAVAFLAATAFASTVQAADISIVSFAGPTPIISVSGQIALNDDLKFEQVCSIAQNSSDREARQHRWKHACRHRHGSCDRAAWLFDLRRRTKGLCLIGDRFVVYATSAPPAGMNWLNKSVLDQFGLSVELKNDVATLVTSGAVVPPVVAGSVSIPPSVFQPVSNPLTSEPDETRPAIQRIKPPPKPPEPREAASLNDMCFE